MRVCRARLAAVCPVGDRMRIGKKVLFWLASWLIVASPWAAGSKPSPARPHGSTSRVTSQQAEPAVPVERPAIAGRRTVGHFDFDEKRLGNFDPPPMYWQRHPAGFPLYPKGKFDPKVGHDAPPEFST